MAMLRHLHESVGIPMCRQKEQLQQQHQNDIAALREREEKAVSEAEELRCKALEMEKVIALLKQKCQTFEAEHHAREVNLKNTTCELEQNVRYALLRVSFSGARYAAVLVSKLLSHWQRTQTCMAALANL